MKYAVIWKWHNTSDWYTKHFRIMLYTANEIISHIHSCQYLDTYHEIEEQRLGQSVVTIKIICIYLLSFIMWTLQSISLFTDMQLSFARNIEGTFQVYGKTWNKEMRVNMTNLPLKINILGHIHWELIQLALLVW